ncbi:MAG: nitroreductase family protein [Clostridia bacterium]|nr:nitroreductase family protein [Clostridia bacterium]
MLKDLIKASRSYRSFDEQEKIRHEQLLDWIDCARFCPSSINLQMLKFRPVTDTEECNALLKNTRWAGKLKDLELPPKGHAPTAYIVICADVQVIVTAEKFQKDVGICAQTIMLAACEAGFGGCMIGSFSATEVSKLLHLPDHQIPQLILALGKPDETVVLADLPKSGDTSYYRADGVHYSPKRDLQDLIVK